MKWETVIGLEIHVELATKQKLFCACSTAFGAPPNTQCCPVCMGLAGTLPVLNREAAELAARVGLALGGTVALRSSFDRKHYFYPDLPKGYQISQLHRPISTGGGVTVKGKTVRIHELHLEEDAGKLTHLPGGVFCDYNRCGVPLIEIVTRPDLRSAAETVAFVEELRTILRYLGVSDCKMQEGSLRCDVNLSVRPAGSDRLGVRTEMKNLASLRAVSRAIEFEAARQIALLEAGKAVALETRRWDEEREQSLPMRPKESLLEYRYLPDPDLPPLVFSENGLTRLREDLPQLPSEKRARYAADWSLPAYDCQMLTRDRALADYFEAVVAHGAPPKQAANWILSHVLRRLSSDGLTPEQIPLSPASLVRIVALVEEGALNRATAVAVFDAVFAQNGDPDAYVAAHGLRQISDPALLRDAAERVLAANEKSVSDYRAGKEKAFGFLMGQVMRELDGKASPTAAQALLRELLDA